MFFLNNHFAFCSLHFAVQSFELDKINSEINFKNVYNEETFNNVLNANLYLIFVTILSHYSCCDVIG